MRDSEAECSDQQQGQPVGATTELIIEGAGCASCVTKIESAYWVFPVCTRPR